jgi:large subunit ribosomal protein L18
MNRGTIKRTRRLRRHRRIRTRLGGTAVRPRLSVFRSNRHLFLQLIDDESGSTLVAVRDTEILGIGKESKGPKTSAAKSGTRILLAYRLGENLAKKAQEKGIGKAAFDRGGYRYHGIIKAVAEGARKGGIKC